MAKRKRIRLNLSSIVGMLSDILYSKEYLERSRKKLTDFTRNRKLPFMHLVLFMLNMVKTSTQVALDRFFELLDRTNPTQMSQPSFSEARQKLKPEAIQELQERIAAELYQYGFDTWHGYAVFAIDGSKIQLPDDEQLRTVFRTAGRGSTAPTAQASILYDTLNDIVAFAEIEPMTVGERTLAVRHIDKLAGLGLEKSLIIFDRGYPAFDLMQYIESKGVKYLMRLRTKFNTDIDAMALGLHDYVLVQEDESINIRVIKFPLPSGEIETLVTNLSDDRMGTKAFKSLYFKRWPVETKYGASKLKFELENFSGRTEIAIRQDFYVTLTLANVASVAMNEAQPIIDIEQEEKENKYDYQANVNQVVGSLKDRLVCALLEPRPEVMVVKVARIMLLVRRNLTPIRPNRSVPRNPTPRKARFRFNQKSNC